MEFKSRDGRGAAAFKLGRHQDRSTPDVPRRYVSTCLLRGSGGMPRCRTDLSPPPTHHHKRKKACQECKSYGIFPLPAGWAWGLGWFDGGAAVDACLGVAVGLFVLAWLGKLVGSVAGFAGRVVNGNIFFTCLMSIWCGRRGAVAFCLCFDVRCPGIRAYR